jgi:hypothetical protein
LGISLIRAVAKKEKDTRKVHNEGGCFLRCCCGFVGFSENATCLNRIPSFRSGPGFKPQILVQNVSLITTFLLGQFCRCPGCPKSKNPQDKFSIRSNPSTYCRIKGLEFCAIFLIRKEIKEFCPFFLIRKIKEFCAIFLTRKSGSFVQFFLFGNSRNLFCAIFLIRKPRSFVHFFLFRKSGNLICAIFLIRKSRSFVHFFLLRKSRNLICAIFLIRKSGSFFQIFLLGKSRNFVQFFLLGNQGVFPNFSY